MNTGVFGTRHQFAVFPRIIIANLVFVMNTLFFSQTPTYFLLHSNNVNITTFVRTAGVLNVSVRFSRDTNGGCFTTSFRNLLPMLDRERFALSSGL